ncbi:MAG: hypothetical protein ISR55_10545 [Bacteroidetes bacterium]|nr:hypothetical protein [Bacteroidota bacterium]MBL6964253.1 hypothetical protein [Bacteroidota bacterium]
MSKITTVIIAGSLYVVIVGFLVVLSALDIISAGTYMIIFLTSSLIVGLIIIFQYSQLRIKAKQELDNKVKEIEQKSEETPEKSKYSWDIARIKLEAYFDRNLSQINYIFWISIFVMVTGFGFIVCGILMSINYPEVITITYIASISGIITEFIGVTFMLIYRSTIRQATKNMNVLERINSVGMAIQILDSIPDSDEELKSQTKAEITKLLIEYKSDKVST